MTAAAVIRIDQHLAGLPIALAANESDPDEPGLIRPMQRNLRSSGTSLIKQAIIKWHGAVVGSRALEKRGEVLEDCLVED